MDAATWCATVCKKIQVGACIDVPLSAIEADTYLIKGICSHISVLVFAVPALDKRVDGFEQDFAIKSGYSIDNICKVDALQAGNVILTITIGSKSSWNYQPVVG